jgi:hypothetical protein
MIAFEVSDTGIGFDAAALPSLFAAFEQGDGSLARSPRWRRSSNACRPPVLASSTSLRTGRSGRFC